MDQAADELEIRNLVARYADAVTRRDPAAWQATWAEDGEWELLGSSARGREEVLARWKKLMADLSFVVQLPHAGIIRVEGDAARGRWTMAEHGRAATGAGFTSLGIYHDAYVRTAAGWRFQRRRFQALYMGPPDLTADPLPVDLASGPGDP